MSDLVKELRVLSNQTAGLGDREAADLILQAANRIDYLESRIQAEEDAADEAWRYGGMAEWPM